MATVTSLVIGNMGAALATALLKSPNPAALTIWNRTASRPQVQSLITAGATFTPSLAAAIARSTTLLICVLDYDSLTSILQTLPPSDPQPLLNKTVINVTNGTPRQARAMATHLASLGCAAYYDGGIMVTPQLVGTAASFVVLSGGESEAAYRASAVPDVLKPIGAVQYVAADAGAASLYDVAALAGMYGMFMGAFTGIALLKKQRLAAGEEGVVKARPATDGVMVPVLTALVPYVSLLAENVDKEDWMEDMGNPLAMQLAGVKNIMQTCEEEGVDGSGLAFLAQLMERAVGEGFGEGGVPAVAKYLFK
jgi:3-hydroxyisobutyrate dehydrogenase-like beta-hydroxyacid dehydrogenase